MTTISNIFNLARQTLKEAGIESDELDTRVLIAHVLKKDSLYLFTHPDEEISALAKSKIQKLIKKRSLNEPVAYLTGHKEFYGHDFYVNCLTLIPRPESEWLVGQALENIEYRISNIAQPSKSNNQYSSLNILDIGTGSGCLIISLVKELQKLQLDLKKFDFYASDLSLSALAVAKKNEKNLLFDSLPSAKVENPKQFSTSSNHINFILSDLFSNRSLHQNFDLILANLPYVPEKVGSLESGIRSSIDYEPRSAIFADQNGAAIIKKFLDQSFDYIAQDGTILIELDPRNAKTIQKYAEKIYPKSKMNLTKDLAGFDRYLTIRSQNVE